jgi:L-cysteine desulfidase
LGDRSFQHDFLRFVDQLAKDKSQFVRTLAQERLNISEEGLKKPWTSAISDALSTAVGAPSDDSCF